MDFRNKKVTVVGLGDSGYKSVLLLLDAGAIVGVTDGADNAIIRERARILEKKYIDMEIGRHTESFLEDSELMVTSPGVEDSSLPLRYAGENAIPVISELELGYLFCKGPIASITGTDGKSTVVSLTGAILREGGIPVNVCGNIGNCLSGETSKIKKDTKVIVETSSAQLERIESFRPKISVILNIGEDHFDRYKDFGEYFAAKRRIYKNQRKSDIAIFNYDNAKLRELAASGGIEADIFYFSAKEKVKGAFLREGYVTLCLKDKEKRMFKLEKSRLKGDHNVENILAAFLVAALFGAKADAAAEAIRKFVPLSHRFETIAVINKVEFINDSKATNLHSAERALLSLTGPVILVAGGKDKNLPYEKILPAMKNVKKAVLIGETRQKMRAVFGKQVSVEECGSLEEAVMAAYKSASPGDYVLLSPMCSSFDMFRDYKHRGEVFKEAVGKLKDTN
ncbi:MAG: UDP-N-acetylmuramoyl-L-alanine--D-glutamate ligase [Candidatus Omnitrophica bacterium]|nr:UDP-N-acetylmuramoyl-L-alanine--D-glutamate ligase [Candidatus Omnitrophota bacterium]